jgi:WD40 repeat protein/energy-coupling factor transporter ATP-binding protein EcfA2
MNAPNPILQPFPGLRPYDVDDATLFFGRHTHVAEMISLLERQRFLAVVGASGSGKSSLVRAGLLPAIRDGYLAVDTDADQDRWHIVIMRPGDDPYRALAEALIQKSSGSSLTLEASASQVERTVKLLQSSQFGLTYALRELDFPATEHLVLLVDQFEELFRFRRDESTRRRAGITDDALLSERRNEANAFVNLLLRSSEQTEQRVFVIMTMRSDFLGDCDAFIGLPEAISGSQYLTPRLTRSQLEEAIRRPLGLPQFDATIEDDLVTRILNDVGNEPDQLPLMQHALMRTWNSEISLAGQTGQQRIRPELELADYERVGGVSGALNQHADEVFENLGDASNRHRLQRVAARLFCGLSERRDGGPLTRRPITVRDAAFEIGDDDVTDKASGRWDDSSGHSAGILTIAVAQADVKLVAAAFEAANLLVFSPANQPLSLETRLDISHESLLRNWTRLGVWRELEDEAATQYRSLIQNAKVYFSGEGELLFGLGLQTAIKWWNDASIPTTYGWSQRYVPGAYGVARQFLDRSREKQERQQHLEATKAKEAAEAKERERLLEQEQSRAADAEAASVRFRRQRQTAILATIVAMVCLVYALLKLRDARIATTTAQSAEELAKSEKLKANENQKQAQLAGRQAEQNQARAARDNADVYWRFGAVAQGAKPPDSIRAAHFFLRGAASLSAIPATQRTAIDVKLIPVHGLTAYAVDRTIFTAVHDGAVNGVQLSRDESHVLTWSGDGTARLWDVTKPDPLQTFKHASVVHGAQFNHDESRVLTWSDDGTARLWDVTKPDPLQTFKHASVVYGAQFNRDESRVLTWSVDGTARLWDVTKPESIQTFKHASVVNGAQFNRDESRVLTWSDDGTAWLWDVTKPNPIQTFKHASRVNGALLSGDESLVLTWSDDGTARLWDVNKADPIGTFKHDSAVIGAQFSRDESRVLMWSKDGTTRLWDLANSNPIQSFKHDSAVIGAQFSKDGSRVLTWSEDKTSRLWEVLKPDPIETLKHDSAVIGAQFNRDESRVLSWSNDGTARLWDVTKTDPAQTFKHDSSVNGALFSRDKLRVLTWSNDGTARLWDVKKADQIRTFKHDSVVNGAQFSRDELHVLTWSDDGTARLWDVTSPHSIQTFKHASAVNGAQFSGDELRVLTWSNDGTARLWDATKGDPIRDFKHDSWVNGAQFSRDELRVLTWCVDGTARLWDVANLLEVRTFEHGRSVNGAKFSGDESLVLTWCEEDTTARLWSIAEPEPIQTFKHDDFVSGAQFSRDDSRVLSWCNDTTALLWAIGKPNPIQTFKHDAVVLGAQFSRDELYVLTWSSDNAARLWEVFKFDAIQTFDDNNARLWDVTKPDSILTIKRIELNLGARLNGDESRLLTWSDDKTARLWDVTKPNPIQTFKHASRVNGALLSGDESRVLTWSDDGTARLWDVTDPLSELNPAERILELEVRSGMMLDQNWNLRVLKFDEWSAKAKSAEYLAIRRKLSAREGSPVRPAEADRASDLGGATSINTVSDESKSVPENKSKSSSKISRDSSDAGSIGSFLVSVMVCVGLIALVSLRHQTQRIP